jgi:hypothetical protein
MPLIGEKNIFAIEWNVDNNITAEFETSKDRYIYANFRYWINSIPVGDYENCVIFNAVVSFTKDFLRNECIRQQFDFAEYSTVSVFDILHNASFSCFFDSKYNNFYLLCREKLLDEFSKDITQSKNFKRYKKQFFDNMCFENDWCLSGWITNVFSITHLGGASFWDNIDIYLVTDKNLLRERLIWKTKEESQIFSAVLPLDYFMNIARCFVDYCEHHYTQATLKLL